MSWRDCSAFFAKQRNIMAFGVWKVLTGFHVVMFYYFHPAVGDLAVPGSTWIIMGVAAFRIWVGVLGFWGALVRSIDKMRLLFCVMILDQAGIMIGMAPVAQLECACHDHYQCAALFSFLPRAMNPINPYPVPDGAPVIPGRLQNDSVYNLFTAERFPGLPPWHAGTGEDGHALEEVAAKPSLHADAFGDPIEQFALTPPGMRWDSENKMCWQLDEAVFTNFTLIFEGLGGRAGMTAERLSLAREASRRYLEACFPVARCAVVEVAQAQSHPGSFDACFHWFPATPVVEKPSFEPGVSIFFQKQALAANEMVMRRARAKRQEEPPSLKDFMPRITEASGLGLIREAFSRVCRCKEGDRCQLRQFGPKTRHWCHVDDASLHHCTREKIEVLRIGDGWWSWELCHARQCQCSGIGTPPSGRSKGNLRNPGLVWDNEMNYGSSCSKWLVDDADPWCFVGLDTTCVDANRLDLDALDEQWRSTFACVEATQSRDLMSHAHGCINAQYFTLRLMWSFWILNLLMLRVVYIFVSNQCGDSFLPTDQYPMEGPSDDSESSNDFDVFKANRPWSGKRAARSGLGSGRRRRPYSSRSRGSVANSRKAGGVAAQSSPPSQAQGLGAP